MAEAELSDSRCQRRCNICLNTLASDPHKDREMQKTLPKAHTGDSNGSSFNSLSKVLSSFKEGDR